MPGPTTIVPPLRTCIRQHLLRRSKNIDKQGVFLTDNLTCMSHSQCQCHRQRHPKWRHEQWHIANYYQLSKLSFSLNFKQLKCNVRNAQKKECFFGEDFLRFLKFEPDPLELCMDGNFVRNNFSSLLFIVFPTLLVWGSNCGQVVLNLCSTFPSKTRHWGSV